MGKNLAPFVRVAFYKPSGYAMPFANDELFRRPRNGDMSQHALVPTSASPATTAQLAALKSAVAVDRNTVWPTHRIRCFLLSQQIAGG